MAFNNVPRTLSGSLADGIYGSMALDLYEQVPDLIYPLSVRTYDRMRTDPQIQAVLSAYSLPIRSGHWAVQPDGCRPEVVQLVADAWGLPVLGQDSGPTPYRRRGVRFKDHLRKAMLMLVFGHSPFAVRYDIAGTPMRARLAELSERLPQTIGSIEINDDGSLKGILQSSVDQLIPANALLWYSHNQEGAAWQGRSMIRASYAPWLIKHELWRVMATSSRRFGMGVPQVHAPKGGTPADVQKAADLAAAYRVGDQSGVGLPDGYNFELTGLTGSLPDTLGFIRYLDQQMMTSVLAEVLNLGNSDNGSRALGDTMIQLLELSWQSVADEIAGPASDLTVKMVDYNWGEDEPVPPIVCSDINRPEVTSEAISALVTCGALTPDLGLENDLRGRYNLPKIEQRPAVPQTTPPVDPQQAPTTQPPNPAKPAEPAPVAA